MASFELFYALTSGASLLAIGVEYTYGRRTGRPWHVPADTVGNLNLAAGNILVGVALTGAIVVGYSALYALRVADVPAAMPRWAGWIAAVVFADFLQYWNHRLSHRINVLWWGHITHHSSSSLNLSTGVRVNWLYRGYAWLLYAPMPLLGFSLESFVLAQTVMNVYNLFMHTRWDAPFGPLGWVLVTPRSHRLHHSADPRYFGNYGAALIVWDRLFGTYREVAPGTEDTELAFGVGANQNVDSADPIALNFHYLGDLWREARRSPRPVLRFARLLFSSAAPGSSVAMRARRGRGEVSGAAFGAFLLVATIALYVNQAHGQLPFVARAASIAAGLLVVTAFGIWLERRLARS